MQVNFKLPPNIEALGQYTVLQLPLETMICVLMNFKCLKFCLKEGSFKDKQADRLPEHKLEEKASKHIKHGQIK